MKGSKMKVKQLSKKIQHKQSINIMCTVKNLCNVHVDFLRTENNNKADDVLLTKTIYERIIIKRNSLAKKFTLRSLKIIKNLTFLGIRRPTKHNEGSNYKITTEKVF